MARRSTVKMAQVIDEVLDDMKAQGMAANTMLAAETNLMKFGAYTGRQRKVIDIDKMEVNRYFQERIDAGDSPHTLNQRRMFIRKLFDHCVQMGYIPASPIAHLRSYPTVKNPPRLRIPASDFARVLDAAEDPLDRMIVALGLHQFHRAGEIVSIQIKDVDLTGGTVTKFSPKTHKRTELPIFRQLDAELRRWLDHYISVVGDLREDYYLIPRRTRPTPVMVAPTRVNADGVRIPTRYTMGYPERQDMYVPTEQHTTPHRAIQRVLVAAGYPIYDEKGKSLREGGHTLRRSGARAFYDELKAEQSHHNAGKLVQMMLGHEHFTTTETYLGIDSDMAQLFEVVRGKDMFPSLTAAQAEMSENEVIPLRREEAN